ncbi:hypothetical protein D7Y09_05560 [bacterium 1XD42-1]|nr:hypothetical protein D7X25_10315 [bacterium 1XD42-8]RKJ65811.1 hypothetical protein D7Y09_05560 [bacterium 1XD42-1]
MQIVHNLLCLRQKILKIQNHSAKPHKNTGTNFQKCQKPRMQDFSAKIDFRGDKNLFGVSGYTS